MRTQTIPAQITTVEDRIAGNLSFTQIIILMKPVLLAAAIFMILPPSMQITWYKSIVVAIAFVIAIILSIRVKGKIVLHWLVTIGRYNLRPKYYVFDKNEPYMRTLDLVKDVAISAKTKKVQATDKSKNVKPVRVSSLLQLQELQSGLSFKVGKKGGLNVAFEQVKK